MNKVRIPVRTDPIHFYNNKLIHFPQAQEKILYHQLGGKSSCSEWNI
jgi:hypothetical protein